MRMHGTTGHQLDAHVSSAREDLIQDISKVPQIRRQHDIRRTTLESQSDAELSAAESRIWVDQVPSTHGIEFLPPQRKVTTATLLDTNWIHGHSRPWPSPHQSVTLCQLHAAVTDSQSSAQQPKLPPPDARASPLAMPSHSIAPAAPVADMQSIIRLDERSACHTGLRFARKHMAPSGLSLHARPQLDLTTRHRIPLPLDSPLVPSAQQPVHHLSPATSRGVPQATGGLSHAFERDAQSQTSLSIMLKGDRNSRGSDHLFLQLPVPSYTSLGMAHTALLSPDSSASCTGLSSTCSSQLLSPPTACQSPSPSLLCSQSHSFEVSSGHRVHDQDAPKWHAIQPMCTSAQSIGSKLPHAALHNVMESFPLHGAPATGLAEASHSLKALESPCRIKLSETQIMRHHLQAFHQFDSRLVTDQLSCKSSRSGSPVPAGRIHAITPSAMAVARRNFNPATFVTFSHIPSKGHDMQCDGNMTVSSASSRSSSACSTCTGETSSIVSDSDSGIDSSLTDQGSGVPEGSKRSELPGERVWLVLSSDVSSSDLQNKRNDFCMLPAMHTDQLRTEPPDVVGFPEPTTYTNAQHAPAASFSKVYTTPPASFSDDTMESRMISQAMMHASSPKRIDIRSQMVLRSEIHSLSSPVSVPSDNSSSSRSGDCLPESVPTTDLCSCGRQLGSVSSKTDLNDNSLPEGMCLPIHPQASSGSAALKSMSASKASMCQQICVKESMQSAVSAQILAPMEKDPRERACSEFGASFVARDTGTLHDLPEGECNHSQPSLQFSDGTGSPACPGSPSKPHLSSMSASNHMWMVSKSPLPSPPASLHATPCVTSNLTELHWPPNMLTRPSPLPACSGDSCHESMSDSVQLAQETFLLPGSSSGFPLCHGREIIGLQDGLGACVTSASSKEDICRANLAAPNSQPRASVVFVDEHARASASQDAGRHVQQELNETDTSPTNNALERDFIIMHNTCTGVLCSSSHSLSSRAVEQADAVRQSGLTDKMLGSHLSVCTGVPEADGQDDADMNILAFKDSATSNVQRQANTTTERLDEYVGWQQAYFDVQAVESPLEQIPTMTASACGDQRCPEVARELQHTWCKRTLSAVCVPDAVERVGGTSLCELTQPLDGVLAAATAAVIPPTVLHTFAYAHNDEQKATALLPSAPCNSAALSKSGEHGAVLSARHCASDQQRHVKSLRTVGVAMLDSIPLHSSEPCAYKCFSKDLTCVGAADQLVGASMVVPEEYKVTDAESFISTATKDSANGSKVRPVRGVAGTRPCEANEVPNLYDFTRAGMCAHSHKSASREDPRAAPAKQMFGHMSETTTGRISAFSVLHKVDTHAQAGRQAGAENEKVANLSSMANEFQEVVTEHVLDLLSAQHTDTHLNDAGCAIPTSNIRATSEAEKELNVRHNHIGANPNVNIESDGLPIGSASVVGPTRDPDIFAWPDLESFSSVAALTEVHKGSAIHLICAAVEHDEARVRCATVSSGVATSSAGSTAAAKTAVASMASQNANLRTTEDDDLLQLKGQCELTQPADADYVPSALLCEDGYMSTFGNCAGVPGLAAVDGRTCMSALPATFASKPQLHSKSSANIELGKQEAEVMDLKLAMRIAALPEVEATVRMCPKTPILSNGNPSVASTAIEAAMITPSATVSSCSSSTGSGRECSASTSAVVSLPASTKPALCAQNEMKFVQTSQAMCMLKHSADVGSLEDLCMEVPENLSVHSPNDWPTDKEITQPVLDNFNRGHMLKGNMEAVAGSTFSHGTIKEAPQLASAETADSISKQGLHWKQCSEDAQAHADVNSPSTAAEEPAHHTNGGSPDFHCLAHPFPEWTDELRVKCVMKRSFSDRSSSGVSSIKTAPASLSGGNSATMPQYVFQPDSELAQSDDFTQTNGVLKLDVDNPTLSMPSDIMSNDSLDNLDVMSDDKLNALEPSPAALQEDAKQVETYGGEIYTPEMHDLCRDGSWPLEKLDWAAAEASQQGKVANASSEPQHTSLASNEEASDHIVPRDNVDLVPQKVSACSNVDREMSSIAKTNHLKAHCKAVSKCHVSSAARCSAAIVCATRSLPSNEFSKMSGAQKSISSPWESNCMSPDADGFQVHCTETPQLELEYVELESDRPHNSSNCAQSKCMLHPQQCAAFHKIQAEQATDLFRAHGLVEQDIDEGDVVSLLEDIVTEACLCTGCVPNKQQFPRPSGSQGRQACNHVSSRSSVAAGFGPESTVSAWPVLVNLMQHSCPIHQLAGPIQACSQTTSSCPTRSDTECSAAPGACANQLAECEWNSARGLPAESSPLHCRTARVEDSSVDWSRDILHGLIKEEEPRSRAAEGQPDHAEHVYDLLSAQHNDLPALGTQACVSMTDCIDVPETCEDQTPVPTFVASEQQAHLDSKSSFQNTHPVEGLDFGCTGVAGSLQKLDSSALHEDPCCVQLPRPAENSMFRASCGSSRTCRKAQGFVSAPAQSAGSQPVSVKTSLSDGKSVSLELQSTMHTSEGARVPMVVHERMSKALQVPNTSRTHNVIETLDAERAVISLLLCIVEEVCQNHAAWACAGTLAHIYCTSSEREQGHGGVLLDNVDASASTGVQSQENTHGKPTSAHGPISKCEEENYRAESPFTRKGHVDFGIASHADMSAVEAKNAMEAIEHRAGQQECKPDPAHNDVSRASVNCCNNPNTSRVLCENMRPAEQESAPYGPALSTSFASSDAMGIVPAKHLAALPADLLRHQSSQSSDTSHPFCIAACSLPQNPGEGDQLSSGASKDMIDVIGFLVPRQHSSTDRALLWAKSMPTSCPGIMEHESVVQLLPGIGVCFSSAEKNDRFVGAVMHTSWSMPAYFSLPVLCVNHLVSPANRIALPCAEGVEGKDGDFSASAALRDSTRIEDAKKPCQLITVQSPAAHRMQHPSSSWKHSKLPPSEKWHRDEGGPAQSRGVQSECIHQQTTFKSPCTLFGELLVQPQQLSQGQVREEEVRPQVRSN
jgi:hypothetical protein